jgi:hypothetical protein
MDNRNPGAAFSLGLTVGIMLASVDESEESEDK